MPRRILPTNSIHPGSAGGFLLARTAPDRLRPLSTQRLHRPRACGFPSQFSVMHMASRLRGVCTAALGWPRDYGTVGHRHVGADTLDWRTPRRSGPDTRVAAIRRPRAAGTQRRLAVPQRRVGPGRAATTCRSWLGIPARTRWQSVGQVLMCGHVVLRGSVSGAGGGICRGHRRSAVLRAAGGPYRGAVARRQTTPRPSSGSGSARTRPARSKSRYQRRTAE